MILKLKIDFLIIKLIIRFIMKKPKIKVSLVLLLKNMIDSLNFDSMYYILYILIAVICIFAIPYSLLLIMIQFLYIEIRKTIKN